MRDPTDASSGDASSLLDMPELLSMFDRRSLEHRIDDVVALQQTAAQWTQDTRPVVVEIGSHRARFLEGQAAIHAPSTVLGLEWRGKYHNLASRRLKGAHGGTMQLLHANARMAVPILFPVASVKEFHVTFPDPWWKSGHSKRRVIDPIFLRVLARRLVRGGAIYIKSDVFDYLHRVRAMARICEALRPLPAEHWPDERPWAWTTREKKCMDDAIPFGRCYLQKRQDFDDTLPTTPEDHEQFPFEQEMDGNDVVRGIPPLDQVARLRKAESGQRRVDLEAANVAQADDPPDGE